MLCGLLVAVAGACGADDAATSSRDALILTSQLDAVPAEAADAVLLWAAEGDEYVGFVWGKAAVEGTRFTLRLDAPPPAEAMTGFGFGMGRLFLAPRSFELTEGEQPESVTDELGDRALGAAERHAVFFCNRQQTSAAIDAMASGRTPQELQKARAHWIFDFPDGYACGVGRNDEDGYAPVPCSEVLVRLGSVRDFDFPDAK